MKIPFLDLKHINTPLFHEISVASDRVIQSGWYILGPELKKFEEEFSRYCNSSYCIGTANGLDALSLILNGYNFPAGSEIIVPANTYFATILAIINSGYQPVLVEPDPATYLIDPSLIKQHITPETRAVLIVELYGKSCDLNTIRAICDAHNLVLIADSAQSHGALFEQKKTAGLVDAAAFSFYPTKNLGALGDGGAVVTNDGQLATNISQRRNYGSSKKYHFEHKGINSRLDEIQAAILSVKLAGLDHDNDLRRTIARKYLTLISNPKITLPLGDAIDEDVWHLFVIRADNRESFRNYMDKEGIQTDVHYPVPPHKQQALKEFNHLSLPVTEKIHEEIVSIPLNTGLTEEQINYIITTINNY